MVRSGSFLGFGRKCRGVRGRLEVVFGGVVGCEMVRLGRGRGKCVRGLLLGGF